MRIRLDRRAGPCHRTRHLDDRRSPRERAARRGSPARGHGSRPYAYRHGRNVRQRPREKLTGEAIAGRRDEVFLVSKVLPSNASYDGTLRACERSLARLGTDHLDLYLLHWEGSYPLGETMRAMERLIDEGQIRFAGVSNFDVVQVKAAQAALRHHRLAANQVLYHLRDRGIERKLVPYCQERQIAVVAYSPFGHEALPRLDSAAGRVLAEVAQRNERTVRQVILNFLTRLPGVFTIPKAGQPEHTREMPGDPAGRFHRRHRRSRPGFPRAQSRCPLGML